MATSVLELALDDVPGIDGRARVRATAIGAAADRRVIVVAALLDDSDPALLGARPKRRRVAAREIAHLAETLSGKLERVVDRERSFVSDAGHELRTPLAILKMELELALRQPGLPPVLDQALRSAAAETDHLSQLTEDLLLLARADHGNLQLQRAQISALGILEGVAERFCMRTDGARRSIALVASPDLKLFVDRLRLEQALGNLVENALRHGAGSIRLVALERDGLVELHVVDEGPGFPPGFASRAFERFSRADPARSGGGAGLGLAIAHMIARAHGGAAHAKNREEGGADVWLSVSSDGDLDQGRCDQLKANSVGRMTTTVAAHRAKTGR